jgi:tetratricopeptide (TPR) repeat protein
MEKNTHAKRPGNRTDTPQGQPKTSRKPHAPARDSQNRGGIPEIIAAYPNVACALVLFAVTIIVFAPLRNCAFILTYDDPLHVTTNEQVLKGLTLEGIRWSLTAEAAANWYPVTLISHMLDVSLFGVNPAGHHLMNVFLHALDTALLFYLLFRITKARWRCAFVAALFALHPLHVQSVAWVSERKDVLSTLFWILTTLAYVRYVERPSKGRYAITAILYALGLMSKPMLVTLPCTLLLLDYWPLGRLPHHFLRPENRTLSFKLLLEKVPLLILTVIGAVLAYIYQGSAGSFATGGSDRVVYAWANAIVAYVQYIVMMFWPVRLAVYYPHPMFEIPLWQVGGSIVLLVAVTIFVVRKAAKHPFLPVGWFWYLGTLVPVIGFVQIGSQAIADRYTYVPFIGLFVIIAWGVPAWTGTSPQRIRQLTAAALAILVLLILGTRYQLQFWKNDETLFRRALAVTRENDVARNNLGAYLFKYGDLEDARLQFERVIALSPEKDGGYLGLSDVFVKEGNLRGAVELFNTIISIKPDVAEYWYKRGIMQIEIEMIDKGIEDLRMAIQLNPAHAKAHRALARALDRKGLANEAAVHYAHATKYGGPDLDAEASYDRVAQMAAARGLTAEGKLEEAAARYLKMIEDNANDFEALNNLAGIRGRQKNYPDAEAYFKRALELQPQNAKIHQNLGRALLLQNKKSEALKHFDEAFRLDPAITQAQEAAKQLRNERVSY